MNSWDKHYIKGTLRKPTNTDSMYPEPVTKPFFTLEGTIFFIKWLVNCLLTLGLIALVYGGMAWLES